MCLIRLCLILLGISIQLCLSSDDADYIEVADDLNFNELNINTTDDLEYEISTEDAAHITEIIIDEALAVEKKVNELSTVLKSTIHRIRQQYKKMDIVFLIDSSSSVGKSNFRSELRFVIKFLSDFNVSFNYTRVSIVTFSSQEKIVRKTSTWILDKLLLWIRILEI